MATPELTSTTRPAKPDRLSVRGACAICYALLWAFTALAAAVTRAGGAPLTDTVRRTLRLSLDGRAAHADALANIAALSVHNLPLAAWPLLLAGAGADRSRLGRALGDSLVAASLAANTIPVGAALGAYGSALAAYVPQLPVEWAALALGAAAWLTGRRRKLTRRERSRWLAGIAVCVLLAAVLETMAVPSN